MSGKDPTSIDAFRQITLTYVVVNYLKEFLSLVKENMLRTTLFCMFRYMVSVKGIHAELILQLKAQTSLTLVPRLCRRAD